MTCVSYRKLMCSQPQRWLNRLWMHIHNGGKSSAILSATFQWIYTSARSALLLKMMPWITIYIKNGVNHYIVVISHLTAPIQDQVQALQQHALYVKALTRHKRKMKIKFNIIPHLKSTVMIVSLIIHYDILWFCDIYITHSNHYDH